MREQVLERVRQEMAKTDDSGAERRVPTPEFTKMVLNANFEGWNSVPNLEEEVDTLIEQLK